MEETKGKKVCERYVRVRVRVQFILHNILIHAHTFRILRRLKDVDGLHGILSNGTCLLTTIQIQIYIGGCSSYMSHMCVYMSHMCVYKCHTCVSFLFCVSCVKIVLSHLVYGLMSHMCVKMSHMCVKMSHMCVLSSVKIVLSHLAHGLMSHMCVCMSHMCVMSSFTHRHAHTSPTLPSHHSPRIHFHTSNHLRAHVYISVWLCV